MLSLTIYSSADKSIANFSNLSSSFSICLNTLDRLACQRLYYTSSSDQKAEKPNTIKTTSNKRLAFFPSEISPCIFSSYLYIYCWRFYRISIFSYMLLMSLAEILIQVIRRLCLLHIPSKTIIRFVVSGSFQFVYLRVMCPSIALPSAHTFYN